RAQRRLGPGRQLPAEELAEVDELAEILAVHAGVRVLDDYRDRGPAQRLREGLAALLVELLDERHPLPDRHGHADHLLQSGESTAGGSGLGGRHVPRLEVSAEEVAAPVAVEVAPHGVDVVGAVLSVVVLDDEALPPDRVVVPPSATTAGRRRRSRK